MQIEPWQVPVLVMAGIAAPVWIVGLVRKQNVLESPPTSAPPLDPRRERMRTTALALLTALILVIFVWALGASTADKLATVASAVTAIVGVSLTLQSNMERLRLQKVEDDRKTTRAGENATVGAPEAEQPDGGAEKIRRTNG
jgi:TRAP-type C4-dicarboxylate transport system permease large subunit